MISKVKVGDNFLSITPVNKLDSEEDFTIEHKPGEVLLVDFWASWCPPCQKPMAHNQEMLEKNETKWAGKVRIVGASIDHERKALVNKLEEKDWDLVDHYILPGNWKHPGAVAYGLEGVPHVCLVDTKGKITFLGHPASIDLEAEINKLLKAE